MRISLHAWSSGRLLRTSLSIKIGQALSLTQLFFISRQILRKKTERRHLFYKVDELFALVFF